MGRTGEFENVTNRPPPQKRTSALLLGRFGPNRDTHSLAIVCRGPMVPGRRRPTSESGRTMDDSGR